MISILVAKMYRQTYNWRYVYAGPHQLKVMSGGVLGNQAAGHFELFRAH